MALTDDSRSHLKSIANNVLAKFETVSSAAKDKLVKASHLTSDVLANVNSYNSNNAINNLREIDNKNRSSYETLSKEPAIARVVVEDESGERKTYYFCRADQGMANLDVISYLAPIGRLASLPVGEEFSGPNGREFLVLERAVLRPAALQEGWDSRNTVVEGEHFGPVTIESLRVLLTEVVGEEVTEDLLGQLLAEEATKANIIDGMRRSVITKMGLRDQPVLDQFQDEIFRLPLDKRLLLLGPPGTGKTTTLIRRLGQKIDTAYMEEHEQRLVDGLAFNQRIPHASSWLMFTPTELLKQYLKEAFARESVPASDLRIQTWTEYRRELGRSAFGVLRTANGGGIFVLKNGIDNLKYGALTQPIDWFADFDKWQRKEFVRELIASVEQLKNEEISKDISERLHSLIVKVKEIGLAASFADLAVEVPKVQTFVASLKDASDAKIKGALNLQLNRDKTFLDELGRFIDGLQQIQGADADEAEAEELESDDDEDVAVPRTGRAAALNAYMQAVRAQARSVASKRTISKSSRNGKIIQWLGDRTLNEKELADVGASLLLQKNARRFINPVKRYIDGIPKRYRAFRRQRQEEGAWYLKDRFEPRDIHPLELDLVLLVILRAAGDLISRPNILRDIESPTWSALQPFLGHYRNQILVDEATDFSPIQLACMAALTHPRLRSFFACGDFNQRLTTWGARSAEDLKWVFPDFDIREVSVSYRQSQQLNDLAREMIRIVGGTEQSVSLPAYVDSAGVPPTLLENAGELSLIVNWLAERIREIERFVGQLPSTAIFVNTEDDVAPVAEALNAALAEHNIQVSACREGQAVGQESNVRVFDIQHIKGLEFEAVFFVGIDQLAVMQPELFDKYLYVGITRAATYLGVTCAGTLPTTIEGLRAHFGQNWQNPGTHE